MKTDIRIIKSKEAIENAFLSLVEIHGYKAVSLTEIAKKARVNRNTIYLHYGSKEGIVEQIIVDALAPVVKDLDFMAFAKARNNRRKIEQIYEAIFNMFNDKIELYRVLLTDEQLLGFLYNEFKKLRKGLLKLFKPTVKNELGVDFLLNGVFAVLSNYTVYARGTAEENIKVLADFTILNLRKLAY